MHAHAYIFVIIQIFIVTVIIIYLWRKMYLAFFHLLHWKMTADDITGESVYIHM